MQKYNIPCINTSAFARLCNTNKRTLIHYDEIGLFKPAYTDARGYRYYSESQCDVFFTITCLKDLGMPLKDIKTYIDNRNPTDLTALLLDQQKKVKQELLHLMRIQKVIRTKLNLVTEGTNITFRNGCSAPFLEEFPEEILIATPYLGTSNHDVIISALCEHIGYVNHEHLNIGHPYGAVMSVRDLEQGVTDRYAYFITKADEAAPEHHSLIKTAGQYAVIYLQGNYYLADDAFKKLLDFIADRNLTAGEFCYKEAVWDELTVKTEDRYITRISIPVCESATHDLD